MPGKLDRKLVKEACGKVSKDFADLKVLDVSSRNLTDVSLQYWWMCWIEIFEQQLESYANAT